MAENLKWIERDKQQKTREPVQDGHDANGSKHQWWKDIAWLV